jgi:hypothetical protein
MARIGQPGTRPSRVSAVLIAAAALGAISTAVVLNQPPGEPEQAPQAKAAIEFRDGFEGEASGGGPIPPDPPALTCPMVNLGFRLTMKDWTTAWSYGDCYGTRAACERNRVSYARSQSYPTPLGAEKGEIVAIPFVARAGDYVNLYFDQVQSRPQVGYSQRPATSMFLGISPCLGDVRAPKYGSPDRFERPECRMVENSGSLIWSTQRGVGCELEAGQSYYLHVMAADPRDGLTPGEDSCGGGSASALGCDVGAITNN